MSTDVKTSWAQSRMPGLASLAARFTARTWPREAPYLALLPWLITVGALFLAASGLVLAVYYNPAHGFDSLQFIDRDVNDGWLIHAFHETGATMIFAAVYLTLFRIMYTRAYKAPGELVWVLGVAQFTLLLLVGYLGYVLADGAVSYWSLTGATQTATALGGLPGAVGTWFFGGPDGPGTLARMVVFHIVLALAIFGIVALHYAASRAITPVPPARGRVSFHPYYTAQYFVAFVIFALIFAVIVFFAPHLGENRLNLAAANRLVVPAVVRPPWYLLSITDVTHAVPGPLGGVIAVLARLAVLFALPWLDRSKPGAKGGGLYRFLVLLLAVDVILLGLSAAAPPSLLTSILAMVFTVYYFLHFLVLTPVVTALEAA